MKRILALDDDCELCELLSEFLTNEGFSIETCREPAAFLELPYGTAFDLLIVDVMLPGIDGFEVLRRVRATSRVPVIMLTARGEEQDRVRGLELGADDYLPKPFSPRELVARIRAIFRRLEPSGTPGNEEVLQVGDLRMHMNSRKVFRGTEEIGITQIEFHLLELLMRSPGQPVRRQDLALQALDRTLTYEDRSLDMHISNLRRKVGSKTAKGELIQTVRSVGYMIALLPNVEP
ncbi:MAG TPA: response regulator transcription factor [Candidatus Ozemobacteraceae bacterium]|nr:response regulator transcription factor [Candidatus Ozemobacteraceae bacterium]